ncbi:MAG: hypothetical protein JO340_10980 [Acidobacteriaceae bacterium]|nr:hypothetical protein [Acidobacteriaceae bacterium]
MPGTPAPWSGAAHFYSLKRRGAALPKVKQNPALRFENLGDTAAGPSKIPAIIFFLTSIANNLIYESHCDLYGLQIYVRENRSMKNATKKSGGAKKTAKKPATKKKGK